MSNKALKEYQEMLKDYYYFITIDPGARKGGGTGVAVFNTIICPNQSLKSPIETYQLESKKSDWLEKVDEIANQLHTILNLNIYKQTQPIVFIERPKFFESFKGHTAATSDSLFKLCFVTGRLYGVIKSFNLNCILLPIDHWKGQLNKSQVSTRVDRICGKKYKGDVTDAVGMGLYLKGLF